jgi:hypothetical protein
VFSGETCCLPAAFRLLADLRFSAAPAIFRRSQPPSSGSCNLSAALAILSRYLPPHHPCGPDHLPAVPAIFQRPLPSSRGSFSLSGAPAIIQRPLLSASDLVHFPADSAVFQPSIHLFADLQFSPVPAPSSGTAILQRSLPPSSCSRGLPAGPAIFQRPLLSSSAIFYHPAAPAASKGTCHFRTYPAAFQRIL